MAAKAKQIMIGMLKAFGLNFSQEEYKRILHPKAIFFEKVEDIELNATQVLGVITFMLLHIDNGKFFVDEGASTKKINSEIDKLIQNQVYNKLLTLLWQNTSSNELKQKFSGLTAENFSNTLCCTNSFDQKWRLFLTNVTNPDFSKENAGEYINYMIQLLEKIDYITPSLNEQLNKNN